MVSSKVASCTSNRQHPRWTPFRLQMIWKVKSRRVSLIPEAAANQQDLLLAQTAKSRQRPRRAISPAIFTFSRRRWPDAALRRQQSSNAFCPAAEFYRALHHKRNHRSSSMRACPVQGKPPDHQIRSAPAGQRQTGEVICASAESSSIS